MENWYPSRFGPDDVLGAFNQITPGSIMAALALVKGGRFMISPTISTRTCRYPGFHGAVLRQHAVHTRECRRVARSRTSAR